MRRTSGEPSPGFGEARTWLSSAGARQGAPLQLTPGHTLADRYTVLDTLGQGGMGLVIAAYDSRLDRRVALKLLLPSGPGFSATQGENSRLAREAQAMARLSHPHVVAVYDSGALEDGSIFIAMEYVQGQTLRQWRKQPRPWREVLEAYLSAGRGLVAAHAAGLIHRDFKPDNVLVGQDGRVRVTDFGLARARNTPEAVRPTATLPAQLPATWGAQTGSGALTMPGSFMGTPGYMAPELLQGHPADVGSDVFAFCAALYEALYGQLPFLGATPTELTRAQLEGKVAPPPASSEVPAWVARTVMRGLSADPRQRPAGLEEVLTALTEDPEAKRRARLRVVGLTSVMAVLAGLAVWGWTRQQHQVPVCGRLERHLSGIWDEPVKEKVKQALLGTGLPYAPDTFTRVAATLDDYSGQWVKQRTEVCEALRHEVRPAQGLAVRQEYCLERRRSQLRALTELLAGGADAGLLSKAVQAARSLPPLEYCADAQALTAAVPPPEDPQLRAQVDSLQARVDRIEALLEAGKFKEGQALDEELLGQIAPLGYAPLHARTLHLSSRLREGSGDYKGAEERMRQAIAEAGRGKDLALVAKSSSILLRLVGYRQPRHQEALMMEPVVEATVAVVDDDVTRAGFLLNLGSVFQGMGRYEQAREKFEQALALLEKSLGSEHLSLAEAHNNLGNAFKFLGRDLDAKQHHERTLALREKLLGAEHPAVALSINNLGNVFIGMGQFEEAGVQYERALALLEKTLGPDHPDALILRSNLGNVLVFQGRFEDGLNRHERALALREKVLGPEHPYVGASLNNIGSTLMYLGRYEEARQKQERALLLRQKALGPVHPDVASTLCEIGSALQAQGKLEEGRKFIERGLSMWEKTVGPEHPETAEAHRLLGVVLTKLGRHEEARRHHDRALALREKALGAEHPDTALSRLSLAELQLARGKPAEALPLLERALKHVYRKDADDVRFALARALWDTGQDRTRARALATEVQEHWQRQAIAPKLAEASRWLAAHADP
ncbi:serine/threonine-protein kinase [Hyalangium rubrum]|uniref:Serine/threonine-protein kinase n=1 Tax=Hyalangium rubrum TaxID=3103134 RepID=A0ABU5H8Q9_9BACT|nr:serine/threonine-protein kinase [Hyalangium sp. s54d21]MDY7229507.1 serine/threonine-protein kinase [Hyalangium sp. s54d21]